MDDPVDFGNIETSSGDICAEEDTGGGVAELEKCVCAFLLLLLALHMPSVIVSITTSDTSWAIEYKVQGTE